LIYLGAQIPALTTVVPRVRPHDHVLALLLRFQRAYFCNAARVFSATQKNKMQCDTQILAILKP